jgi:hypothetical protein
VSFSFTCTFTITLRGVLSITPFEVAQICGFGCTSFDSTGEFRTPIKILFFGVGDHFATCGRGWTTGFRTVSRISGTSDGWYVRLKFATSSNRLWIGGINRHADWFTTREERASISSGLSTSHQFTISVR